MNSRRLAKRKATGIAEGRKKSKTSSRQQSTSTPANDSNELSENEDGRSEGQGEELNETGNDTIDQSVSEVRKVLEGVLVKLKVLEDKVNVLDLRVTEVQLNRSENGGQGNLSIGRKQNPCTNDKDSLFKEAFENATGKLKVRLIMNLSKH